MIETYTTKGPEAFMPDAFSAWLSAEPLVNVSAVSTYAYVDC
jgi:hypothetical protein